MSNRKSLQRKVRSALALIFPVVGAVGAEQAKFSTSVQDEVIDSLKLARKKSPGKKNTLDALCERYSVDSSDRTLHGALLDARLLAHVYLKMTVGQNNFSDLTIDKKFEKINELKKYLDVYLQNKICHGDLHLGNIFLNRNKFYFLDWDYYVLSSSGYDLAMFAYLEKLNKKQIEKISLYSKVSLEEIHHYLPICQLLDYLYLSLDHKKNGERVRKLKLKVDKFILNNL